MPKIIIDNHEVECREGVSVLEAALEAGWDVPHYCFHPGLKVVASCRLCLMEMKMPHPQTRDLAWAPKLIPSCQTKVREGMEIRFDSDKVRRNRQQCLELLLLNHPLDCPVCDQAGECLLQDYAEKYGRAESRMVDAKYKDPKRDIGPRTLLYSDRCVMCTRCVRFTAEISGTHELAVVNRGSRNSIDAFPGRPLDNPLQGNVVDVCPVGSMLDKDFRFKQRVWFLESTPSVCPGCAQGCSIWIHKKDDTVYRLKPRYNPKVNTWWMCDEGRFGFKYLDDEGRITVPLVRRGQEKTRPRWEDIPELVRVRFGEQVRKSGAKKVAAVLSPFMACEEAWLLVKFIRELAPEATLVLGPVPCVGEEQHFPVGASGDAVRFTILPEKCPNRRGVEMVLKAFGGPTTEFEEFTQKGVDGEFDAMWIVGGYPQDWVGTELVKAATKTELLVVQDMFESGLTSAASIVLPAAAWAEREGSFANAAGLVQAFARAVAPRDGAWGDGRYLFGIAGYEGLYSGTRVRELMAETIPAFSELYEPPARPAHAH